VKNGGIVVIDNVLWYGRVADENVDDRTTLAIRELNDFIASDPRVSMTLLPIGDGLILCRKLDGRKQR
jgi:predicted O-methyltransferase YrrM